MDAFRKSIPQIVTELWKAKKRLRQVTLVANDLRRIEQQKIVAKAAENNRSAKQEQKSQWDIEEARRLGRLQT